MRDNCNIWLSIFWGVSQVVLATFPAFAKEILAETNTVVIQELLACSGAGITIGSLGAGKIISKLAWYPWGHWCDGYSIHDYPARYRTFAVWIFWRWFFWWYLYRPPECTNLVPCP
ncbi:hypothetical protein [Candidatus Vondammii sp. HM_W22]|uniref:hypothetical protein n=1 Tax=Candidatus Vondammii sp. HM_W22 TaxID=2687299 RepID=UPI001F13394B|nr:hypothetical protein [Candidatus Vondammii sp. HM_W22]